MSINTLGLNPIKGPSLVVTVYDLTMFASFLASIVLGIIALTRKRERSWWVWLFMIPVVSYVATIGYMLSELWKYQHPQKEFAPTPDAAIIRIPVIYDDDGSPDGTSALLYLLSEPRADVRVVSVSYGEAHPQVYIQHLGRMLERYGYGDIPLGAGQDAPLAGDNSFPYQVREYSNEFWGFAGPNSGEIYPVQDSAELIVKTITESDKQVTLFISGALTNLAEALRLEPAIREDIAAVYIMGGAVYVPGNLNGLIPGIGNTAAEWNIYVDPQAASDVFGSGLSLYLVPLDATNLVTLAEKDTRLWQKGGSIPDFAAEIYNSRMMEWNRDDIEMWDLVTAVIMLNPELCRFTPLRLEVVTEEGNTQGQTRAIEGEPYVNVCLEPDSEAIKMMLAEVFSTRK